MWQLLKVPDLPTVYPKIFSQVNVLKCLPMDGIDGINDMNVYIPDTVLANLYYK